MDYIIPAHIFAVGERGTLGEDVKAAMWKKFVLPPRYDPATANIPQTL